MVRLLSWRLLYTNTIIVKITSKSSHTQCSLLLYTVHRMGRQLLGGLIIRLFLQVIQGIVQERQGIIQERQGIIQIIQGIVQIE